MAGPKQTVIVGDKFPTYSCGEIKVVNYTGTTAVTVVFEDGTTRLTSVAQIRNGLIRNNFKPIICGVGYLGVYGYASKGNIMKKTPEYVAWVGMLERCYNNLTQSSRKAYIGCSVDVEWHNFNTFATWYKNQNGYGKGFHLDKDLTVFGNRVYSENTCALIPSAVNKLLELRENGRGDNPLGVHWCVTNKSYIAQVHRGSGKPYIGSYSNKEDAFYAYKVEKELYIKKVAEDNISVLSNAIYDNLMNYSISITD